MTRIPLVLTALATLVAACGGGGDGAANSDCPSFCAKIVVCDQSQTEAECEATCAQMSQAFRAEVGARVDTCADLACDAQSACLQGALRDCGGNYAGLLRTLCQKEVDCGAPVDVATCVSQYQANAAIDGLSCLNDATMNAIGGCAQDLACATIENELSACIEDRTGISF